MSRKIEKDDIYTYYLLTKVPPEIPSEMKISFDVEEPTVFGVTQNQQMHFYQNNHVPDDEVAPENQVEEPTEDYTTNNMQPASQSTRTTQSGRHVLGA